ncbi:MAG: hypothetical protein V1484_02825 [bacterium]
MPDDPNTTQNPTPEENPSPTSLQEPTEPAPENTAHSEPSDALPEAPEAPGDDFEVKSNDIPPSNSTPTEVQNEQKTEEKQAENEPGPEPVSEPVQATEPPTAQISTNEPLESKPEELPPSASLPEEKPPASPEPKPRTSTEATPPVASFFNHMRELQVKEQLAIKNKKRKKLDLLMTLFLKKSKITNDEVEKFLHVSDATATRYLSILEKEGKIKQNGKTGKGVSYSKII